MKVAILGASGVVGRKLVDQALSRGLTITGQTRTAAKLADVADRIRVVAFDPRDQERMAEFVEEQDAVIFALGTDTSGATTLFSDVTSALIKAMMREGVRRLIAITGVGAGDTLGTVVSCTTGSSIRSSPVTVTPTKIGRKP